MSLYMLPHYGKTRYHLNSEKYVGTHWCQVILHPNKYTPIRQSNERSGKGFGHHEYFLYPNHSDQLDISLSWDNFSETNMQD